MVALILALAVRNSALYDNMYLSYLLQYKKKKKKKEDKHGISI